MPEKACLAALAVLLSALLAGCALYPAVQVAGGAMTGYDAVVMADDYLPRDNVEGGALGIVHDTQLERRLRERLELNDLHLSAHVIDSRAYLIGQVRSRTQADYAIRTAATVQGIRTITCKFYPAPPARAAARDAARDELLTRELAERFGETKRLQGTDLRVEVVRSHAILIGRTRDYSQKTAALAIAAEINGLTEIIDYITVEGEVAKS
ncbi:transport-associated protein [Pseudodesulfovibrio mercurii]|uniref:Transport-associated protein n=1 Tax=Pseudodesulfovibrio mercurii TaxID=641491 RepID=F0JKN6_9BACT|nr:BON domain-containing protein [Pseudodesulfovibrio mercurii]EGB16485.1 transport-associated protein [Pseudodesulfovibrio mercurii]